MSNLHILNAIRKNRNNAKHFRIEIPIGSTHKLLVTQC